MSKELTEKQKEFIRLVVYENLKPSDAAKKAGYSDKTLAHLITDALRQEIIDETERMMATHVPSAARVLIDQLDPEKALEPGSEKRANAATQLMDRTGLTKRERPQQIQQGAIGVVFLPAKKSDDA